MGAQGDFKVTVSKKEVVASALPLQQHWLPQSNLDLILPPIDVSVFFCYNGDEDHNVQLLTFESMVSILKKALAQTLVNYYAFAGEIVPNSFGEPELLCNNRGVDFVEAYADISLENLNFYNPDESIEGKLVPSKKQGVLSVQVTELKCGGIVVGCTFDHRIADAYSNNMFLVSWAEMAQSKPISVQPSFRRSLLNPRRPGYYHPSLDNMYVPITALPPPPPTEEPHQQPASDDDHHQQLISRIYSVSADQIAQLQSTASTSKSQRTKLESFSAFLWQMVAKATCVVDGQNNLNKNICKMGIVVDGRARLNEGLEEKQQLMGSYFGNVLSIPFGEKTIDELNEKPLSWVADSVHDYLEGAVTKDHFLDLIDWVESQRPVPTLAKIYCSGSEDGPALVVSSGQRFPVSKIDFGWGKPFFGSYHFPWGGASGYVMPMPTPAGNGDWVVYMHLLKGQLELIEAEASHIFKPLSFDYLKFITSPSN